MPKGKSKKKVKRTFRHHSSASSKQRRAFNWEDRQTGDTKKKLDSEFSRGSEKDPEALEMGEYVDDGKGLPKVKKESSTAATKKAFEDPRRPARKKERGMPRRKGMEQPYGAQKFTPEDDATMMREMGQEEEEDVALEEFDLEDLDFGDLPELDEEEVEEVEECPPGCVPAEEEDLTCTTDEEGETVCVSDEEEEDEDDEEEDDEEEDEEGETKEASVEEDEDPDNFAYVLAADQLDSVDIQDLDFPIFDLEGENPHYLVLHKGEPVAKIALRDQPMPEEHRGPFLNDKYVRTLTGSIERVGLGEALHLSNARIYATQASRSQIAEEMKKEAKSDMDQAFRNNIANLSDNLMNTVSLAIEASVKNLILENPLKEALVEGMRRTGISERGAIQIVEGAFHDKGSEYFQALTAKAQEWMGMPEEAYKQVAAMVSTSNYAHPEDIDSSYSFQDEEDLRKMEISEEEAFTIPTAMPKNVPLRTVASPKERRTASAQQGSSLDNVRNDLRGRLNVRSKLTSQ